MAINEDSENVTHENAQLENAAQTCRGWKTQDWKIQHKTAVLHFPACAVLCRIFHSCIYQPAFFPCAIFSGLAFSVAYPHKVQHVTIENI